MKVVINVCHGGFSLSPEAELELWRRGKLKAVKVSDYFVSSFMNLPKAQEDWKKFQATGEQTLFLNTFTPDEQQVITGARNISRNDEDLIEVVQHLGKRADGRFASLKVVDIPDDVDYEIEEYDGLEWIAEKHRTWS